jgi:DNA-binding beta-propeller fold protein YncE
MGNRNRKGVQRLNKLLGIAGLLFLIGVNIAYAASFTAANNGSWNLGTTWHATGGCSSSCTEGVDYPGPNDTANISSKTVTLSANQNVGTTSISGTGVLNLGSYTLNVYNIFSNYGTFNAQTGTVNFVGALNYITGSSTFYNLTKQATSSPAVLNIGLGTTSVTNGLTLTGTATNTLTVQASEYGYLGSAGTYVNSEGVLFVPNFIAVDSSDNTYITQYVGDSHTPLQKFDSSGNPVSISSYGTGSGAGQFGANGTPSGVAYSTSTGYIYVVDNGSGGGTDNNRINVFDSSLNFIETFGWGVTDGASSTEVCTSSCKAGSAGSGNGQYSGPTGIASAASGNLYVGDSGNHRIEEVTTSGGYVTSWGTNSTTTGNFTTIGGVAVDNANGYVYVVDDNGLSPRVEKFDLSGNFISQFPSFGTLDSSAGNGKFDQPHGIAVDSSGNVYISDEEGGSNPIIEKFNSSGVFQSQWSDPYGYTGLAVDSSGNILTDGGAKFNSSGTLLSVEGITSANGAVLVTPYGVGLDSSRNVYIADSFSARISEFDQYGNFIKTFGWGVADGASQFEICTASSTCESGKGGSGNGQFNFGGSVVDGLTEDSSNDLYVVDSGNKRVQEFSSSSSYIGKWGSSGTGAGQFSSPTGIAIDTTNSWIYLSDKGNNRVEKFDLSGNFISMFGWGVADGGSAFETCTSSCQAGISGSGNGQFSGPEGVSVDSAGNVYVVDSGNSRVQEFSSSESYLGKFGSSGGGNGQFYTPNDVKIDS